MWGGAYFRTVTPDWWGKSEPIFLSAGYRSTASPSIRARSGACGVSGVSAACENSIFIKGCLKGSIEDILLENVSIRFRRLSAEPRASSTNSPRSLRHRLRHNSPALYLHHCENCEIDGLRVGLGQKPGAGVEPHGRACEMLRHPSCAPARRSRAPRHGAGAGH